MTAWEWLTGGVLLAVGAALISIVASTVRWGISPMPTSSRVRRVLEVALPEAVDGDVHEFGAGWGGVAWRLAERYPKARVVAWEVSWVPYVFCRLRAVLQRRDNLVVVRRDFFQADLGRAGLVVCYVWTGAMTRLAEKFRAELRTGAVVVSHTFALPGWTAEWTERAQDLYQSPVYRYRK